MSELLNNGNTIKFGTFWFEHPETKKWIYFKNIVEVSFEKLSNSSFSKLFGKEKGVLKIKYKLFDGETEEITIEVKSKEFQYVVDTLLPSINKEQEEEKQRLIIEERRRAVLKKRCEEFNSQLNSIPRVDIELSGEKVLRKTEITHPYESTSNITKKSKPNRYKDFVVVDTETTGIKTGGNDIIEVSAIKFENLNPVAIFTTLLKPRKPISQEATAVNGITNEMVNDKPSFAQIKNALELFIGNYPIVAHNAAFDIKFLHVSGMDFKEKALFFDTLELSRRNIRDGLGDKLYSYKLVDVCEECEIYFDGAHRASADAYATGLLFVEILKTIKGVYTNEELLK